MAGEVIEFVDSVSATALVRLSLTTGGWTVLFQGTSVPPPPFRRALAQTFLADGGFIPASAYDNRVITLRIRYDGTAGPTSATAVQVLNRELDRERNILRWQPDNSIPAVYFHTFRSPDYDPITDHGLDQFEMTIHLVAEPFALGLPVTVTPIVVQSDPAHSQGKWFEVNNVQGDVETPLMIKIPGSSGTGRQSLFAVRRGGVPSLMPFVLQAEIMGLGTNTTIITGGADWSPSATNNETADTSFATVTAKAIRLSAGAFPSPGGTDTRGTYRVFARVGCNTLSSQFGINIGHGLRNTQNPEVIFSSNASSLIQQHVDLGLVQIPEGFDPITDGPTGVAVPVNGVQIFYNVRRMAGNNMYTDYLLFVPADDAVAIVKWGGSNPTQFVFNGYTRSVYGLDGSGRVQDIESSGFVGGVPMVSPGVFNRIVFMADVTPTNTVVESLTGSVTISPSYWPRYLSVRPTST
jgi:hypothetical protein